LVGRSEDNLQALAQRLERQSKITATVLTADLASSKEVDQLVSNLKTRDMDIDLLINNAGFGVFQDKKPELTRNQMDDPKVIVQQTLRAFDRGKRVFVPGKLSVRLTAFSARLFPRALVAQFGERVALKLNHV